MADKDYIEKFARELKEAAKNINYDFDNKEDREKYMKECIDNKTCMASELTDEEELKAVCNIVNEEWDQESTEIAVAYNANLYHFKFKEDLSGVEKVTKYANIQIVNCISSVEKEDGEDDI